MKRGALYVIERPQMPRLMILQIIIGGIFIKSFIPWMGGKYLLANTIVSQFPADIKKYTEVFGGGGSVLFAREKHAKTEIYNDLNSNLVNLFRCMKHHAGELQKEISGYLIPLSDEAVVGHDDPACRRFTQRSRRAEVVAPYEFNRYIGYWYKHIIFKYL